MKISFVINEPVQNVSGGYKMVYTYANELAKNGDKVTILYHCRKNVLLSNYKAPYVFKCFIAKLLAIYGPSWFKLSNKINRKIIQDIDNFSIPDGDIVIATAADTSPYVYRLDNSKGKKAYFIQGYENWVMNDEELVQTYQYNMVKITVSNWLKKLVEKYSSADVFCVLNGIRNDIFYIKNKPEDRDNQSICMLYHNLESKGSNEGVLVLKKLKKKYPLLSAHLFGVVDKPKNLPVWISYIHNATPEKLNDIYNSSMIYLYPSWNEGFGLTGAEAMMSGCVLVSTATDGVKEYASDDIAFLVNIHDTEEMFNKCCYLFDNDRVRNEMANKGAVKVGNLLNYDKSVKSFTDIMRSINNTNFDKMQKYK